MAIRKVPRTGQNPDPSGTRPSPEFVKAYPLLWEQLAEEKYEDGSPRRTGSLSVFLDQGALKGALNDRDQSLVAFVLGESVQAILDALEQGLADETLEWRRSVAGAPRRSTRRS